MQKNCKPSATSSNTSKRNRPSSSNAFRNFRRCRARRLRAVVAEPYDTLPLGGGHNAPAAVGVLCGGHNVWQPYILFARCSCHVERNEISRIFAVATRSRTDQRLFAPLRMTSLRQLQLSIALLDTTTDLPNAAD